MKYFILGKKGEEDSTGILYSPITHIILIMLFFSFLLVFAYQSSEGATAYEQIYSKQIALLIDKSKPYSEIIIDFEKGYEIAEKNKINKKLVEIKDNAVIVSLSDKIGYSTYFFKNYEINIEELKDKNKLKIIISND